MIEALIQTASSETAYRRAGRGPHVLLLTDGAEDDPLRDVLFSSLAEHFRVIAPCPVVRSSVGAAHGAAQNGHADATRAPAHADPALLRDIIDGLGLERPSIVADEASGVAALAFALLDPERVARIVVVRRSRAGPALPPHAAADTLARAGHEVIVLQLQTPEPVLPEAARALLVHCVASGRPDGLPVPCPAAAADPGAVPPVAMKERT
jgi:pimeloyl-ACP methyl ester carboxylesterase